MSTRARLLALAGLASLSSFATEPPTASVPPAFHELMMLLAARRQGHVSFTEVHEMAMLKAPLTSSGELFYDAPARLEKRTLEPKPETLVLDHGVLTAQRGHRQHVLELAAYPQVVPFVESIRATLAGDEAALERYFMTDFTGDLARWSLRLTPRDPAIARSITDVTLAGERDAIRTIEIRERDGDRSRLTLGPEITP
jgi:hypothetical protein